MNQEKLRWYIEKQLYQLRPLDAGIVFIIFLIIFIYFLVIPQYQENLDRIHHHQEQLFQAIQQDKSKNHNLLSQPDKILEGVPLIEISKFYQHEAVQVIDAKYDQKSEQVLLQLQGNINNFLKISKYLQMFSNLELVSIAIKQNEHHRPPEFMITWQIKVVS